MFCSVQLISNYYSCILDLLFSYEEVGIQTPTLSGGERIPNHYTGHLQVIFASLMLLVPLVYNYTGHPFPFRLFTFPR